MADQAKSEKNRMFIINEPNAPRLSPALAVEIGLVESVLLLQIEFWIAISQHYRDGHMWTYQSLEDIHETFPFWSTSTINRALHRLVEMELITVGNFNHSAYDRTRWFTLNEVGLARLQSIRLISINESSSTPTCKSPFAKLANGSSQNDTTIPETTTETTTEITENARVPRARDAPVPDNGTTSLSPPDALFQEIMTVCQHTDHTITPAIARHISAAAERLAAQGATPEDVRLFPTWWATYWKGRNGNPIEPRNVMEEWGRFTAWRNQQTEVERKIEQWDGWLR